MKGRIRKIGLWILLLCSTTLSAEVVTLRSGKVMTGTVIVQNDEVLILRDANGARFQFPAAEVVKVEAEEEAAAVEAETAETTKKRRERREREAPEAEKASKVALRLTLNGGGACVPGSGWGGSTGADLWIGSRRIGGKRVFMGGGVGFEAVIMPDRTGMYIPLQAVVSLPLTDGMHAPEIGLGIGYGFATHKTKGGLAAHVAMSWRYQYSGKSALLLGARVAFQADDYPVAETLDGKTYSGNMGRNQVMIGINIGIEF